MVKLLVVFFLLALTMLLSLTNFGDANKAPIPVKPPVHGKPPGHAKPQVFIYIRNMCTNIEKIFKEMSSEPGEWILLWSDEQSMQGKPIGFALTYFSRQFKARPRKPKPLRFARRVRTSLQDVTGILLFIYFLIYFLRDALRPSMRAIRSYRSRWQNTSTTVRQKSARYIPYYL